MLGKLIKEKILSNLLRKHQKIYQPMKYPLIDELCLTFKPKGSILLADIRFWNDKQLKNMRLGIYKNIF